MATITKPSVSLRVVERIMHLEARAWVDQLGLIPHPEGGYFVETYRSGENIAADALPSRFGSSRHCSTAIYFLLDGADFSAFHRLKSDEVWHYYAGGGLSLFVLAPPGDMVEHLMGASPLCGQAPQVMVPAGCWLAARNANPAHYSLVGCTMAPGFDFADFELGNRAALLEQYPQHLALINSLTRHS